MAARIVVALENFSATHAKREVFVHMGDRFRSTHALVKAHPAQFGPVDPEPVDTPTRRKPATLGR
jgi:hypothetical protein